MKVVFFLAELLLTGLKWLVKTVNYIKVSQGRTMLPKHWLTTTSRNCSWKNTTARLFLLFKIAQNYYKTDRKVLQYCYRAFIGLLKYCSKDVNDCVTRHTKTVAGLSQNCWNSMKKMFQDFNKYFDGLNNFLLLSAMLQQNCKNGNKGPNVSDCSQSSS